ncbi:unknown [Prevotella sp. CAG:1124]|nr:unknown [Prevotella sp. CAG:1124]
MRKTAFCKPSDYQRLTNRPRLCGKSAANGTTKNTEAMTNKNI